MTVKVTTAIRTLLQITWVIKYESQSSWNLKCHYYETKLRALIWQSFVHTSCCLIQLSPGAGETLRPGCLAPYAVLLPHFTALILTCRQSETSLMLRSITEVIRYDKVDIRSVTITMCASVLEGQNRHLSSNSRSHVESTLVKEAFNENP